MTDSYLPESINPGASQAVDSIAVEAADFNVTTGRHTYLYDPSGGSLIATVFDAAGLQPGLTLIFSNITAEAINDLTINTAAGQGGPFVAAGAYAPTSLTWTGTVWTST